MAANHTANPVHVDASVWDSPRQDDATNARIVTLADSGMADDRGFVPGLVLNTWILESRDTGKFAGYGLAEINNCTGRSRSKERLRRT
ncbi:MAG TPA: hypothetical protein VHL11_19940 [Phototrophicaceae bacterium]|nr:hypothetical protein [Phototrophicaceae bacterium]